MSKIISRTNDKKSKLRQTQKYSKMSLLSILFLLSIIPLLLLFVNKDLNLLPKNASELGSILKIKASGRSSDGKSPTIKVIFNNVEVSTISIKDDKEYEVTLPKKAYNADQLSLKFCNDTSDDGTCVNKSGGQNRDISFNYALLDNEKYEFSMNSNDKTQICNKSDSKVKIYYNRANKNGIDELYDWGKLGDFGTYDDDKGVLCKGEPLGWGPIFSGSEILWNGSIVIKIQKTAPVEEIKKDLTVITSPVNNSTIQLPVIFSWKNTNAKEYHLYLGSSVGAKDYFTKRYIQDATSDSISNSTLLKSVPDNTTIYARMWTNRGLVATPIWEYYDYTYTNKIPVVSDNSCNVCGLIGKKVKDKNKTWSNNGLLEILQSAANAYNVPSTLLAGVITWEGWDVIGATSVQIQQYSAPGAKWPIDCTPNSHGAAGPFQIVTSQWNKYKNSVISDYYKKDDSKILKLSGRSADYIPEVCNIKDAAFAAAAKLRNDLTIFDKYYTSCEKYDENPAPLTCDWSKNNVIQSACHYYGKTGNYVCAKVDANEDGVLDGDMCYVNRATYYLENFSCK